MASKFQSRLVGTIILVAVGVIVLPDVLDGKKLHYKEEFASIPIKPELDSDVENFEILEPVEDDITLPDSPVEAVVQEREDAQVAVSEPEPVPTSNLRSSNNQSKLRSSLVLFKRKINMKIQLGSFS